MTKYIVTTLSLMVALLCGLPDVIAQTRNLDLERIRRATVFIIQASEDDLTTRCVGTGTVVRYDGLILTNAHNTVPSGSCPGEELIIAMTVDPDEPPVPKYRAEIAQTNPGLDLALLRITRELDGRLIDEGALPVLPFVEIADDATTQLDQTLTVVGYPGIGNDSIESILGTVTGFIAEPSAGEQAWIKATTVSAIPGTMSGGGAYNQQGELVGVPTTTPVGVRGEEGSSCRLLEDTNDDGFINSNDACVPIGDFIDVLRPASFARPLIRSASLNLSVETLTTPDFRTPPSEEPSVTQDRLFFALSVENGLPDSVVSSAPAGTTSLYLFFDYRNFTAETIYELRVSVDGVPSPQFSLPPVRWSGGTDGLWYIGSSGQPWTNGVYEFRLFVNGLAAASKNIAIGGGTQERPTFSKVAFGLLDDENNFQGDSYVLPAGNVVQARFIYRNMQPGLTWAYVWYYNGAPLTQQTLSWASNAELSDPANGTRTVSIQSQLQPGNYRLELYIQQPGAGAPTLSAVGQFIVAGQAAGVLPDVFSEPEFLRAANPLEPPTGNPASTFPDGVNTLYTRFDWQTIAPGTLWTMRWQVDDTIFYEQTLPWRADTSGDDFTVRVVSPGGLPDGTYTISLSINDILLEQSQLTVGIGQLEIDRLTQAEGVQLRGQIVDALTGTGIEGATFILITEDFAIADFVYDTEQIYALATTDRNGNFEIERPLQLDSPYSVLIEVEGYLPIEQDGFLITQESLEEVGGSPIEMTIPMMKD